MSPRCSAPYRRINVKLEIQIDDSACGGICQRGCPLSINGLNVRCWSTRAGPDAPRADGVDSRLKAYRASGLVQWSLPAYGHPSRLDTLFGKVSCSYV